MVVPDVDKSLLEQLESMGFPPARATRALHYSGKSFDYTVSFRMFHLICSLSCNAYQLVFHLLVLFELKQVGECSGPALPIKIH